MASLSQNEKIIASVEAGFVKQGAALAEIRDKAQFRPSKERDNEELTWAAYCTDRWDYSQRHADRTIAASAVAITADQFGLAIPNEGCAREVTDLADQPDLLEAVLRKAQPDSGRMTAKSIRDARKEIAPAPSREPSSSDSQELEPSGNEPDPNQGEDWENVLQRLAEGIKSVITEVPDQWLPVLAGVLEGGAEAARKKASRTKRRNGK